MSLITVIKGSSPKNIATNNLVFTANSTTELATFRATFNNGSFRFNTKVGFNSNPLAGAFMYINALTGERALYLDSNDDTALFIESVSGRGISTKSTSNRGVEGISTTSYGGHFKSADNWALWSQSTSAGTKQSIFSNGICRFRDYADAITILELKDNGNMSAPNVQVGNAGLSSGDLYFDTAANALANSDLVCIRKV